MSKSSSIVTNGYARVTADVEGLTPFSVHNARLANPLDEYSQKIKELTSKGKKKTEADQMEIARLEFLGGLYLDEAGEPHIPEHVWEGGLFNAAAHLRLRQEAKSGIVIPHATPITYDGPRDPEKMWKDGRWTWIARVCLNKKSIMRCRPCWRKWSILGLDIDFLPEMIDEKNVRAILEILGSKRGFCENRPQYGRFRVTWR